jgi:S-adenosylmethionine synthetase
MNKSHLFTSESVSIGHPDKVADQIADAILDEALIRSSHARVACEVLVTRGRVILAGEFKTVFPASELWDRASSIARHVLYTAGYFDARWGFDAKGCEILSFFGAHSANIDAGVSREGGEIGAGDQGLMFGYACDETPELMPLAVTLARRLMQRQAEVRRTHFPWLLGPDAKSQVTVRYEDGRPTGVETVVLSTQHSPDASDRKIRDAVRARILDPGIPAELRLAGFSVLINPAGRFEIGGPQADSGVTGRKIIADTYGGSCPHGGGAFSGKDPTTVDRSGALAARYIAKNVVAAGLARRCTVQLAYAIGRPAPVSVFLDCHGTGAVEEARLETAVRKIFPLTPRAIIEDLHLDHAIWLRTAAYGPFASEASEFTWENTEKAGALRRALG